MNSQTNFVYVYLSKTQPLIVQDQTNTNITVFDRTTCQF